MSLVLPTLYHWSPASRYVDIKTGGLRVYSDATVGSVGRWPYLCFGFDPMTAWRLSADMVFGRDGTDPEEQFDLWAVTSLPDSAEIHVNPEFGGVMKEIRSMTSLPAHCLWHCGRRGDQEIALKIESDEPLTGADFGLGETQMIECPDQETIDTFLDALAKVNPNAHISLGAGNYLDWPRIHRAMKNIIGSIPNPEGEQ